MAEVADEIVLAADLKQAERRERQVLRLQQRARTFQIRRDRYLEPLPNQRFSADLGWREEDSDDEMDQSEENYMFMQYYLGFVPSDQGFVEVYRPKDGDYRNLQLFARSLVRLADDALDEDTVLEAGLCLFLALPQGGLVVLSWLGAYLPVSNVVFNGGDYEESHQEMGVQSLDEISASLFLPEDHTIEQHGADLDTVFSFMISLVVPENGPFCTPEFTFSGDQGATWPLSSELFRSSMEALALINSKLCVHDMLFSEEQWQLLQSMPFRAFVASHVALGTQFPSQTSASEVSLLNVTMEEFRSACTFLGMRQLPINKVSMKSALQQAFVLETTDDADLLLGALAGASRIILQSVEMTPSIWEYFWLKMRKNTNLRSLEFDNTLRRRAPIVSEQGDDNLWWLKPVRDCLTENWPLEWIDFWGCRGVWNETREFWSAEVIPLLKINRLHLLQLPPTECLGVVQEAIIRVSTHPKKVHSLLKTRVVELALHRREHQVQTMQRQAVTGPVAVNAVQASVGVSLLDGISMMSESAGDGGIEALLVPFAANDNVIGVRVDEETDGVASTTKDRNRETTNEPSSKRQRLSE